MQTLIEHSEDVFVEYPVCMISIAIFVAAV